MGGWWRWALISPDGVALSRMVGVSASVNLPLHHKVQKFSSGTSSPGWSRKKGRKTVVVVVTLFTGIIVGLTRSSNITCSDNWRQVFLQARCHSSVVVAVAAVAVATTTATTRFCWSKVLLPTWPCWQQLVHWIRKMAQEFSSIVLPELSPNHHYHYYELL